MKHRPTMCNSIYFSLLRKNFPTYMAISCLQNQHKITVTAIYLVSGILSFFTYLEKVLEQHTEDCHRTCPALYHCWTHCWSQSQQSWCSCLYPAEDSLPTNTKDRIRWYICIKWPIKCNGNYSSYPSMDHGNNVQYLNNKML